MPILSDIAKKMKINFFLKNIDKDSNILEIGCGSQWLGNYLKENGFINYTGIDLVPPADVVGDILNWKSLGLKDKSFDYIFAFEVIEHVDILNCSHSLLKDAGLLMITTPIPHMDWLLNIFEIIGLNQKRTSPHNNLLYLNKVNLFRPVYLKKVAGLSQWAILKKQ